MPLVCLLPVGRLSPGGIRLNEEDWPVGQRDCPQWALPQEVAQVSSCLNGYLEKVFGMGCAKKDRVLFFFS